jgi:glycosyltransferase 2 family protein
MGVRVWDGTRAVKLLLKCLVTALMLFVAFHAVDVAAVSRLLSRLSASWAGAAFAMTALIIVSDAILLERMMRVFRRRMPFGTALTYSFVGWFFSNVSPSTVGGDIFRGVQLSRVGMSPGGAARLVVAIRVLSFTTLVVVMLIGFPIALEHLPAPQDVFMLGSLLLAAISAIVALFFFAHLARHVPKSLRGSFFRKLDTVAGDFRTVLVPRPAVAAAWLAALLQHFLRVASLACLAEGLGLDIPFALLFAVTPAALLMAMLPISLGGWGIRELTFVYFLGAVGVGAEPALSLSIAFGLLRAIIGAMGGATWVAINDDHFRVDASA